MLCAGHTAASARPGTPAWPWGGYSWPTWMRTTCTCLSGSGRAGTKRRGSGPLWSRRRGGGSIASLSGRTGGEPGRKPVRLHLAKLRCVRALVIVPRGAAVEARIRRLPTRASFCARGGGTAGAAAPPRSLPPCPQGRGGCRSRPSDRPTAPRRRPGRGSLTRRSLPCLPAPPGLGAAVEERPGFAPRGHGLTVHTEPRGLDCVARRRGSLVASAVERGSRGADSFSILVKRERDISLVAEGRLSGSRE